MGRGPGNYSFDVLYHQSYELLKARKKELSRRKAVSPKRKSRNITRIDPREVDLYEDEPELGLGEERRPKKRERTAGKGELKDALVVAIYAGGCRAVLGSEVLDCALPSGVDDAMELAVGDRVRVRIEPGRCVVAEQKERSTVLARPDPLNPRIDRVVAANIDVVVHVASLASPPLRERLIDRYLIAVARGGARPVVAVNKIDLLPPHEAAELLAKLEPYRRLDIPVIEISSKTGQGIDELRQQLAGETAVLVGHSGVGKSSIIKALKPTATIRTGKVGAKGAGRHTTTRATLYELPSGTRIIDTPGIREFGISGIESRELRYYFPELEEYLTRCRFADCLHAEEPECAVKEAVESGDVPEPRYEVYRRILDELREEEKSAER